MEKQKFARVFLNAALVSALSGASFGAFAATSSPNVSLGKNLYVAGAVNSNWKPEVYTDGKLDFNQVSSVSDFALNVGEGPTKLFITWETRGDESWAGEKYVHAASCQHSVDASASLQNFKVMTSANSTNGVDGDWETVAEVGESGAMSRGLAIDFAGKSWFRIVAESPVKNLEEVGAYDISDGANDTWFFMGTSISQMGMKQFAVDSNFAQLIHARFADYYPAMLRGGIGCVTSQGVVDALKYYAEYVGNVKFWAIEMGTNDAWGGSNANVETFTKNLQTIIDTAKAHGVTPIIARMIATNPEIAKWQVHQDFLDAIDKLTKDNELPAGPDFYNYFLDHPEELSTSDGVHPAEPKGGQSMHRLWAEAVAPLYKDDPCAGRPDVIGCGGTPLLKTRNVNFAMPRVNVNGREISISGLRENDRVTVMDAMGHVVWNGSANVSFGTSQVLPKVRAGNYFVNIRSANSNYSTKILIK